MSRLLAVALALIVATLPLAAQQQTGNPAATVSRGATTQVTQYSLATIHGNAKDSLNGQLSHAFVRLRDARIGRIMDLQLTDKAGLFAFKAVEPGSYIVEIVDNDRRSVLAASPLVNLNAGDAVSLVVKLPFRTTAFGGLLGGATSTALLIAAQAAAGGIAAVVPTKPVSPNQ